jgi:hypothetical protein
VPWLIATSTVPTTSAVKNERRSIGRNQTEQREHSRLPSKKKPGRPSSGRAQREQERRALTVEDLYLGEERSDRKPELIVVAHCAELPAGERA